MRLETAGHHWARQCAEFDRHYEIVTSKYNLPPLSFPASVNFFRGSKRIATIPLSTFTSVSDDARDFSKEFTNKDFMLTVSLHTDLALFDQTLNTVKQGSFTRICATNNFTTNIQLLVLGKDMRLNSKYLTKLEHSIRLTLARRIITPSELDSFIHLLDLKNPGRRDSNVDLLIEWVAENLTYHRRMGWENNIGEYFAMVEQCWPLFMWIKQLDRERRTTKKGLIERRMDL